MVTRYDAAINGTWLSEVDESVIVTDVQEQAQERISTGERPLRSGLRFIRRKRESLTVSILFVIWEQDVERRKEILQKVLEWIAGADGGGYLEVNDRDGQRLYVQVSRTPSLASALRWTDELTLELAAYEQPFWTDSDYVRTSTSSAGSLYVPGAGETPCEADVTNTGGSAVTYVTISAGDTSMTFSGISLSAGQVLSISYDARGVLSARIGSASVLPMRTESSADDLNVRCGQHNSVSVSANGSVTATFKARGVYP